MKKIILYTLLMLFGATQALANDYEYVPFVREGVKWVYDYDYDGHEDFAASIMIDRQYGFRVAFSNMSIEK